MNDRRQAFILAYIADPNATQAAIKAGYSPNCAKQTGSRLLSNADVKKAVTEGRNRAIAQADTSAMLSYETKRAMLKRITVDPDSSTKDVLKAIEIDNTMAGDNAPQRMDLASDGESIRPVIHFTRRENGGGE